MSITPTCQLLYVDENEFYQHKRTHLSIAATGFYQYVDGLLFRRHIDRP